jgi:carboxyl-terminal processing protease
MSLKLHFRLFSLLFSTTILVGTLSNGAHAQDPPGTTTSEATPEIKKAVLDRLGDILKDKAYVPGIDFSKWPDFFEKKKIDVDKATTARDFASALNQALRQFGVSHIVLSTPQAAEARRERKSIGIGVTLQQEEAGLRVVTLFEGAPAFRAGLDVGDLIVEANGKKPENPSLLAGDEGSKVVLKVVKASGKTKQYTIVREKFSNIRPETLTWVDKETAVLKISTFDFTYNRKNVSKFMKDASVAKRLILDLRSNGGGAVNNLVHLLGFFLPKNTPIGTFVGRKMVDDFVKETGLSPNDTLKIAFWSDKKVRAAEVDIPVFKGKVAVLVNGGTGSASEIVSAALSENLGAPIVGSRSAGAVLVSIMTPLPNGYSLQYPISDYVTMRGIRLEKNGVTPEVEAPISKFGEKDVAIEKAVALLHRIELRDARYGDTQATK